MTHLSEDVTDQWLVQNGAAIDELEQVHAGAMLLHDQHEEVWRLVEVQHLQWSYSTFRISAFS